MLSDEPNASWHPALMPNSNSDLLQPPRDLPEALPSHDSEVKDANSIAGSDAVETTHNQSIGDDAWFPDYSAGHVWENDATKSHAASEVSRPEDAASTIANGTAEPTSTASKHFSTMSFTRTVPHEVSWNDDDDPEWNLPRTGTDPFKFMPPNDRTNSFPQVPPQEELPEEELAHPLSPNQAEAVLHVAEQENRQEAFGSFNADPEALGASFDEEEIEGNDFFQQMAGGELSGTTEEAMEARFEEGVPLIVTASGVAELQSNAVADDLFDVDDATEDDFFSQVRDNAQPTELSPLERKSTMQVLGALDPQAAPNFTPLDKTAEEENVIETALGDDKASSTGAVESQDEVPEDLDAKWKAMFGDDEEDGFLPDDDTEAKDIDAAGFLGSDDEGFLDDSELPLDAQALPQTSSTKESNQVSARYLPPAQPSGPATNFHPPAVSLPPAAVANPYLPSTANPVFPLPVASPYTSPSSAPPLHPRYGVAPPPPTQEQKKAQSFVDKAKSGYTSPYDLPMEVVKPKLRASTPHTQRSISTPNVPPSGPPAPPRSTSMNSPLSPPKSTFGQGVPPIGPSHSAPGAPRPPPAPPREKFFEDLPIATKPRPASRQSNKSVPSPPQASPYAPPPHAVPPSMVPQASPFQAPPTVDQPTADIPRLVAPPPLNPYTQLPSGSGLGPSVPATAPSRYSPAPASMPPTAGPVSAPPPAPGASRYSPAPSAVRQVSSGYVPGPSASAPPMLPHQPRTSSPLAHFEISHERSRSHAPSHFAEGGLADKRSTSSLYESRLPRVPSLPPTTEVEEDEGRSSAQTPTGYIQPPLSLSPESRHVQGPPRARQTPPPSSYALHSTLSPPKRAVSSHGVGAGQQDFAPPQRSQTQSPGKLYGNQNGKPVEPIVRPSSVHGPTSPQATVYAPAVAPTTTSRPRGFSQNLNHVPPTDGRELDLLQRWKGVPLFSWGVAGTIVTMFPKDVPRYGINQSVPMVVRSPGEVKVQSAKDIQPLEERLAKFPGPLKGKSKKKETIAWLAAGIESLERDQSHNLHAQVHLSHDDKRLVERILLWKILRLFIEYDGVLEGNPAVEKAVRDVLSPNHDEYGNTPTFIAGADVGGLKESPVTRMQSDAVDSSTVEQIRKHLLNGESEKAIWAAADVRLWGHALLLANALAPNLYKQVAREFIKKEVNFPGHNNESLAALYGVLSGNHEESVDELVPVHARAGLQLVAKNSASGPSKDAMEGLDKWRETLSLVLSNRSAGDVQAISSLGNLLSSYGRAEAAHVCFMFARSFAIFGGLDDPNSNFVLVGSDHKRQAEQFAKEIEPLLLSEVYEYGQSLVGGSNVTLTSPHLAAYKLQHAYALAEYGYRDKALQYCEAISTAITAQTKRSPYHHPVLETAVEDLAKRLKQTPKEESNSWISKPSMNKVSDTVWNRFNKFVAGDDNDRPPGSTNDGDSGPFARVAGGTPTISRPPSTNNLETFGAAVPSYGMPMPPPNGQVAAPAPPTRAGSRYAPASGHPVNHAPSAYEPGSPYGPRSSMERTSSELARTSSELRRQSSESQRPPYNIYNPIQPASPSQSYIRSAGSGAVQPPTPANGRPPVAQAQVASANSGYEPSGYSAAPVNGNKAQSAPQVTAANANSGYQHHSYGYEPPSFTPFDASAEKEEDNSLFEGNAGSGSYEPPSYQPYSYEAPSYELESQPRNVADDSDEESKPKPKKKGIMYDEDDDVPMPALKSADKSKEEKDRENAEMFRKAAEEDGEHPTHTGMRSILTYDVAKRAAEAKQGKKGWGFTGWFGGGTKKESVDTPAAAASNKPIRANLGDSKMSFYYDPEQKRWVNKNADPKDNEAKKATPPPPKGMPRSVSSSPAPPMAPPGPTSNPDAGRASAPPMGPPRSTMTPPPPGLTPSISDVNSLGPPAMIRSVSNTSTASAPSRPTTSLSNSSSIDDLLSAAGPRKAGAKKPRKSARYVDVMTKD